MLTMEWVGLGIGIIQLLRYNIILKNVGRMELKLIASVIMRMERMEQGVVLNVIKMGGW